MEFQNNLKFAQALDKQDELNYLRHEFHFPQHHDENVLYFTGNSLGLQPKSAKTYIENELESWKNHGVEGHFVGDKPWMYYHHFFSDKVAKLVGAKKHEVVVMNNLTVNLHLMMISFYNPKGKRNKIIIESGAFPSDQYAVESQAKLHNLNPDEVIIELKPRENEYHLRKEDILQTIETHKDTIALILLSGVQYYTGQAFDIKTITAKGHEVGALVGWDLAHATGNIELKLNEWGVDFAAWCTYKYLNSGPGGVSSVYVNEKYANDPSLKRLAGWWGHQESSRFLMKKGYIPEYGAAGWQLSNAPVISMAVHLASLDMFDKAGMPKLIKKAKVLNAYLEFIILQNSKDLNIITPKDERGCQISIIANHNGKELFDYLSKHGAITDWREPNVIRLAPVPMYNSFEDCYKFGLLLHDYFKK